MYFSLYGFRGNRAEKQPDGSFKILVDPEACVECGSCFDVCMHEARDYRDDTERFFEDLKKGVKISLLVAPSLWGIIRRIMNGILES